MQVTEAEVLDDEVVKTFLKVPELVPVNWKSQDHYNLVSSLSALVVKMKQVERYCNGLESFARKAYAPGALGPLPGSSWDEEGIRLVYGESGTEDAGQDEDGDGIDTNDVNDVNDVNTILFGEGDAERPNTTDSDVEYSEEGDDLDLGKLYGEEVLESHMLYYIMVAMIYLALDTDASVGREEKETLSLVVQKCARVLVRPYVPRQSLLAYLLRNTSTAKAQSPIHRLLDFQVNVLSVLGGHDSDGLVFCKGQFVPPNKCPFPGSTSLVGRCSNRRSDGSVVTEMGVVTEAECQRMGDVGKSNIRLHWEVINDNRAPLKVLTYKVLKLLQSFRPVVEVAVVIMDVLSGVLSEGAHSALTSLVSSVTMTWFSETEALLSRIAHDETFAIRLSLWDLRQVVYAVLEVLRIGSELFRSQPGKVDVLLVLKVVLQAGRVAVTGVRFFVGDVTASLQKTLVDRISTLAHVNPGDIMELLDRVDEVRQDFWAYAYALESFVNRWGFTLEDTFLFEDVFEKSTPPLPVENDTVSAWEVFYVWYPTYFEKLYSGNDYGVVWQTLVSRSILKVRLLKLQPPDRYVTCTTNGKSEVKTIGDCKRQQGSFDTANLTITHYLDWLLYVLTVVRNQLEVDTFDKEIGILERCLSQANTRVETLTFEDIDALISVFWVVYNHQDATVRALADVELKVSLSLAFQEVKDWFAAGFATIASASTSVLKTTLSTR